jgi:hypothetical protein
MSWAVRALESFGEFGMVLVLTRRSGDVQPVQYIALCIHVAIAEQYVVLCLEQVFLMPTG